MCTVQSITWIEITSYCDPHSFSMLRLKSIFQKKKKNKSKEKQVNIKQTNRLTVQNRNLTMSLAYETTQCRRRYRDKERKSQDGEQMSEKRWYNEPMIIHGYSYKLFVWMFDLTFIVHLCFILRFRHMSLAFSFSTCCSKSRIECTRAPVISGSKIISMSNQRAFLNMFLHNLYIVGGIYIYIYMAEWAMTHRHISFMFVHRLKCVRK